MTVSIKVRSAIERSSWIRRMFEEGAALIAEYGAENVTVSQVEGWPVPSAPMQIKEVHYRPSLNAVDQIARATSHHQATGPAF